MQRSAIVKLLAIFVCTFLLLIALFSVGAVVNERQQFRDEASQSIVASYASGQTLIGPIFVESGLERVVDEHTDDAGKSHPVISMHTNDFLVFPRTLSMSGTVVPSLRRHGLYQVPVYELQSHLESVLDLPERSTEKVEYSQPYLLFALTDFRGIVGMPKITINGQPIALLQAARAKVQPSEHAHDLEPLKLANNMAELVAPLPLSLSQHAAHLVVSMDFVVGGTQTLRIAPVADLNEIQLQSSWPAPLFSGSFLPRTRDVNQKGFHAMWQISSLASATQQQIPNGTPDTIAVTLANPIDPYRLSDRAVKYGVLFILLTFGSFFVFEIMKQSPIHPVQYLLVGFGLVLFFLLLISFSEHTAFGYAYLIASVACISLLTFYLSFVLKKIQYGLAFGAMLVVIYAAIYGLLISDDNALLLGTLLLFAILAGVMVITRRVDWYRLEKPSGGQAS